MKRSSASVVLLFSFLSFLFFPSCSEITTGPQTGDGLAPPNFYLNQNYPNPFPDTTTIEYGVPASGGSSSYVSVIVYDRFQSQVRVLTSNSSHPSGNFKTKWDGQNSRGINAPPGVYIIEMKGYTPQTVILRVTAIKN